MDGLIAEAVARGQVGLELVSVDSTIVRAHHESAGLAVSGEVLDALEMALAEENMGSTLSIGERSLGEEAGQEADAQRADGDAARQERAATPLRRKA